MNPSKSERAGGITMALAVGACFVAVMAIIAVNIKSPAQTVDAQAAQPGLPASVSVTEAEFTITPARLTANAGLIDVTIHNAGTMVHNFAIASLGKKSVDIPPGGSATLSLGDVKAGSYPYQCDIAGHADSGMKGTLVVGSGGGTNVSSSSSGSATATTMAGMNDPSSASGTMSNADMEKAMTGGVNSFLAHAKMYANGTMKAGNQPLAPTILADGTKQFHLTAAITNWEVSPGKIVKAWTYNGTVPGPAISFNPGDKVQVVIKNNLPVSTDIHMHGIDVPFDQDGVAPITQPYVEPGASYTYHFIAPAETKLGMYHAHMDGEVAIVNGLFGSMEDGHVPLPVGQTVDDVKIPATLDPATIKVVPMVLNDAGVIGLSLNGKAFPETAPIVMKQGSWIRLDYYNEGEMVHPMHIHHLPLIVVAEDGYPLSAPYRVDTLMVAPGQRFSVLVYADDVGTWAMHCHIVSHAEGPNGFQGMVTAVIVQ